MENEKKLSQYTNSKREFRSEIPPTNELWISQTQSKLFNVDQKLYNDVTPNFEWTESKIQEYVLSNSLDQCLHD